MPQVWLLHAAALCLCVSAAMAVEDTGYIKVADITANFTTANIVSMDTVFFIAINDNSVPDIDKHDSHVEWTHGKTKLHITVEWSKDSGDMWRDAQAGVSNEECSFEDVAATLHVYPGSAGAQKWLWPLNEPSEEGTGPSGGKVVKYTFVEDRVVSLQKAPCTYIVVDSLLQASAVVEPSQPSFPATFYAGIESTHIRQGYSRYGSEAYSKLCDTVSFAFYNSDVGFKRVIGDYKAQTVWHITSPNSTFPNGVCWKEDMSNRPEFIEGENGGLVSSAKFLGFVNEDGGEAEYVRGGSKVIRGIPSDQWKYRTSRPRPGSNQVERLTVHLYFSSPEWHFAKSVGHRILQRVEITGHVDDNAANTSAPVENSYDYVDFRPFLPPWAGFEPCEIMPGGDGCECLNLGCTDNDADGRGVVTTFASPASCEALGHNGASEGHKRALLLIWLFGVLVGAALAAGVAWLAHRYVIKKASQDTKESEAGEPAPAVLGAFAPSTESHVQLPYMEAQ